MSSWVSEALFGFKNPTTLFFLGPNPQEAHCYWEFLRLSEVFLGQTERGKSQSFSVDTSRIAPDPETEVGGAVSSRHRKDQALWEVQGSGPQLGTSSHVSYIHTGQSGRSGLKSPPPWTLLILSGTRTIPSLYLLCCCCLVTKSCPTICNAMDYSTPGLPVPHHLPEFAQVCVHWIGDVIQPLSSSKDCSFEFF